MRVAVDIEIAAPVEKVWQVVSDVEDYYHVFPDVTVQRHDSGDLTAGSRWTETRRAMGVDVVQETEVVAIAPPTSLTVASTSHGVITASVQQVEVVDERTSRLRHHVEVTSTGGPASRGAFTVVSALTRGVTRRSMLKDLHALKTAAEAR